MNRAFSVPFFSLNMAAQPRKFGSFPKKVVPETIKALTPLTVQREQIWTTTLGLYGGSSVDSLDCGLDLKMSS